AQETGRPPPLAGGLAHHEGDVAGLEHGGALAATAGEVGARASRLREVELVQHEGAHPRQVVHVIDEGGDLANAERGKTHVTSCSMAPNRLRPAGSRISIRMRSPARRKGVWTAPPASCSRMRCSTRQEIPRLGSSLDTVPEPRIVPATNARVRAMCSTRSKNEKCI